MKQIKLSKRLEAVAGYVCPGAAVADIGTDHGYIPVYLAQRGIARRILAADIRKGPLERAEASALLYGVADKIEFFITDGLEGLEAQGLDTVILAGMGGETILGILERAVWIRSGNIRLILQPQSKCKELSKWLGSNGFAISDARLVSDDDRIYITLLARPGDYNEAPLQILFRQRDPLFPDYLGWLIQKKRRVIEGLGRSLGAGAQELATQKDAYETLTRMKKETDKWQR